MRPPLLHLWIAVLLPVHGVRDREEHGQSADGVLGVEPKEPISEVEGAIQTLPTFDSQGRMQLSGRYQVSKKTFLEGPPGVKTCEIHSDGAELILADILLCDCKVLHFFGKLSISIPDTFIVPGIKVYHDVVLDETADLSIAGTMYFTNAGELQSTANGGGLSVWGDLYLHGKLKISQTVDVKQRGFGGALFVARDFFQSGGTLEISDAFAHTGGGMYVRNFNQSGGTLQISNVSTSAGAGGAIYADGSFTQSGGNLLISSSSAGWRAGAIFTGKNFMQTGGSIEIDGSKATEYGGSIWAGSFVQSNGQLQIANSVSHKGTIYVVTNFLQSGGSLKVSDCTAKTVGGALYVGIGNFTLSGGTFTLTNVSAQHYGGAMHIHWKFTLSGGNLTIRNARNDRPEFAGGAVSVNQEFSMSGGNLVMANVATSRSGALHVPKLTQYGGNFFISNSSAKEHGGAMYVEDFKLLGGALTIYNSSAGRRGGSIFCKGDFTQSGGVLSLSNTMANQGGGLFVGNISLSHSTFSIKDASSGSDGGGIYVRSKMDLIDSTVRLTRCRAQTGGGAILVRKGMLMTNTSLHLRRSTSNVSAAAIVAGSLKQIGGDTLVDKSVGGEILHFLKAFNSEGHFQLRRSRASSFAIHAGSAQLFGLRAEDISAAFGLLVLDGKAVVRNASFEGTAVPQLRAKVAEVSNWRVSGSQAWIAAEVNKLQNVDCDADYGGLRDYTGIGCRNCTVGFTFLKEVQEETISDVQKMQGCVLCPLGALNCNSSRLEMPAGLMLEKGNVSRSIHCPNPLACPGGWVSDPFAPLCAPGYEGLGCNTCSSHCGRSDSNIFVCLSCAHGVFGMLWDVILFLAGDAIIFVMSAARVIGATSTNRNSAVYLNQLMAFASATAPALLAVKETGTFRDQLKALQLGIGVASAPVLVGDVGQSSTHVSAECLLTYLGIEPSLISSQILSAVVYLVLAFLLAMRAGAGVALVVSVNCFLPKFCAAFGRYLICYRMEPASIQPEQECLLSSNFLMLGRSLAMAAIAVCFIVGPGSWLKLTRDKTVADTPQVLYLTRSYQKGYETWEVERLVRKMLLKLVSTTFPVTLNPSIQMAGVNFILIGSLSLHATNKPYMKAEWNRMELALLVAASVIIVLTTLCLANEIHWAHSDRVQISLILAILGLLIASGASLFTLLLREFIKERQKNRELQEGPEQLTDPD